MIVTVAEGGLLSLTQQMDAFHQLGSPPRTSHLPVNPFVSSKNNNGGMNNSFLLLQNYFGLNVYNFYVILNQC